MILGDGPVGQGAPGVGCVECGEDRLLIDDVCRQCRACRAEACDGDSTHPDSWDGYCPTCADRLEHESILAEQAAAEEAATTGQGNAWGAAESDNVNGPQWTYVQ